MVCSCIQVEVRERLNFDFLLSYVSTSSYQLTMFLDIMYGLSNYSSHGHHSRKTKICLCYVSGFKKPDSTSQIYWETINLIMAHDPTWRANSNNLAL
jgi:hypothetical protein